MITKPPVTQNTTLESQRALVCGASRGIGAAIALQLAQNGAEVLLLARDAERLKKVYAELPTPANQQHQIIPTDLNDLMSLKDMASKLPFIHILINNAGGPAPGPLIEATPEAFVSALNQHVLAAQLLTQALAPGMSQAGYGRIINIISTSVKAPIPGLGVSNTIRGAMASWAKTMAFELGSKGITVNNVLPGFTNTERLEQIIKGRSNKQKKPVEEITKDMLGQVPLGRFAEAEEIAQAVVFLASPAASYISGINLPVDGGRTQSL